MDWTVLPNFHHLANFWLPVFGLLGLSPHSSLNGPHHGSLCVKQFFSPYTWSLLLVEVLLLGFIVALNKLRPSSIWI